MSTTGRTLSLAIPGLLDAVKQGAHVPASLVKILARANVLPCAADYTAWMFALFDIHTGDFPVAAVTRAADKDSIEPGWWLRADPVYLHADGDSLLLFDNRSLPVTQDEAAALVLELQDLFQEHDAELSASHPKRWYVHFTHDPGITTHALDKVLGKHIHACLPNADDAETARRWRRLFNEVQMRLHASPVNQARIERGALPINSLWFWGGGRLDKQPAARYKKVHADEALALGLAMLSGAAHAPAPSDAQIWLAAATEPGEYLAVLEPFMPEHTLGALEDRWFAPLLALLKARELERLELWLGGEKLFEVTPSALGRWWKRPRNLAACA